MNAIVSVTSDWGIGHEGALLVRNREDMRRFVDLTMGGTVVMGRRTLESFPGGPLRGRRNVVITRREGWAPEGVETVPSPAAALELVSSEPADSVWLIGGASVYGALLDACERVFVTKNDCVREADAWFPDLDESPSWEVEREEPGGVTAGGVPFSYVTYVRRADAAPHP